MAATPNPFCVPGRTFEEPGPLTPWQEDTHSSYYAVVDHTEEAYQEFVTKSKGWNIATSGAVVMVHGEDGCGKTSLIHRCANAVMELSEQEGSVQIINRSAERLDGQTAIIKCVEVVRAVLRHLKHTTGFLSPVDLQNLPVLPPQPDQNDLRSAIEEVAEALKASKRTLIIIPSKLEIDVELQTYMSVFTRACIVLLMETSAESLTQFVDRWNLEAANRKILSLGVGPLEIDHGWTFVQSRVGEGALNEAGPQFDENAVLKYMQARSQYAKVSIRELERVCLKLFEDAVGQSKNRIEYVDFADLWVRHGGVLR